MKFIFFMSRRIDCLAEIQQIVAIRETSIAMALLSVWHTLTHTQSHTHSLAHSHTYTNSHTHPPSLACTSILTLAHTHPYNLTHSHSLVVSHTHMHSHSSSCTHTCTCSCSHFHSFTLVRTSSYINVNHTLPHSHTSHGSWTPSSATSVMLSQTWEGPSRSDCPFPSPDLIICLNPSKPSCRLAFPRKAPDFTPSR